MKLLKRLFKKDNRGLSLVELICAIAILGAVSTAIGGAMIISADSYKRGTSEADLQKASQFTANVIEGLLIDATKDVTFSGNVLTVDNAEVGHVYTITLTDGKLYYADSAEGSSEVIATNVSYFSVDTSEFAQHRNLQIDLKMVADDGREISTVYNVTSRNNKKASTALAASPSVTITVPSLLVLEPNQEYDLPVTVNAVGGASNDFTVEYLSGSTAGSSWEYLSPKTGVKIKVARDEAKAPTSTGEMLLSIKSVAVNASTGSPDTKLVRILVRRVTEVKPKLELISGTRYKKNSVYLIKNPSSEPSLVKGFNLDRVHGTPSDDDYIAPYGVTWTLEGKGSIAGSVSTYVEMVGAPVEDGAPYIKIRLKEDLPIGSGVKIIAKAKHPRGNVAGVATNKSNADYDDVEGFVELMFDLQPYLESEFLRGKDFVKLIEPAGYWQARGVTGSNQPYRYVRYCPATLDEHGNVISLNGTWSSWVLLPTHDTPGFVTIRPNDFGLNALHPELGYAIEVRLLAGYSNADIRWPEDWSGSGDAVSPSTSEDEDKYTFRFTVPPVTLRLQSCNGSALPADTAGVDMAHKIHVYTGQQNTLHFQADAAHKEFIDGQMKFKIWKETGVEWESCDSGQQYDFAGGDGDQGDFKIKFDQPGTYMVELYWTNNWNKDEWTNAWGTSVKYSDESNGKGIFYFQVD